LHRLSVTATGTAQELVRPIADALVIDEQARRVTIPDQFALTPAGELGLADPAAVPTTIALGHSWTNPGVIVHSEPNTFGFGLDRLVGLSTDWDRSNSTTIPPSRPANPGGDLTMLSWLDGDMHVTMSGSLAMSNYAGALSDDEILDVARGIRFTDAGEFLAVSAAVTDRLNSEIATWATHDETATADGFDVSIRTSADNADGHALCLVAPSFDCTLIDAAGGLADGGAYGAKGFDLGDRQIGLAWISTGIDGLTGNPTLRPSDHFDRVDGDADGTTATIIADTTTNRGRFVIVTIPDGERPPTIAFHSTDPTGPRIDLTPSLHQP